MLREGVGVDSLQYSRSTRTQGWSVFKFTSALLFAYHQAKGKGEGRRFLGFRGSNSTLGFAVSGRMSSVLGSWRVKTCR